MRRRDSGDSVGFWCRMSRGSYDMLREMASRDGTSMALAIERCVRSMHSESAPSKHVAMARLELLGRKMTYVSRKMETFFRLITYVLPYVMSFWDSDPDVARGRKTYKYLLEKFRNESDGLTFEESIYGKVKKDGEDVPSSR